MPVTIQVSSKPAGEPISRVISAATMKMPDPIIEPTTIIVPSKSPMARTKPASCFAVVSGTEREASAMGLARSRRTTFDRPQNLCVLARSLHWVARVQNIADHGHAIRPCFDHSGSALQRNAPNRSDGFVRKPALLSHQFQTNNGIGLRFRRRWKNRPYRDVVRGRGCRDAHLLEVVRGNADYRFLSGDSAGLLNREVVLADVYAGSPGERGYIRAIIHDKCGTALPQSHA